MGIVFRQSVKTTIVTFTGAVLGAVTFYICSFLLSKQELGFYKILIVEGALAQIVVLMGAANLLPVFIQKYPEEDKRRPVLITVCFIAPIIFAIIYTIPYLVFRDQITHLYQASDIQYVNAYYYWLPILIILMSYVTLMDYYLVSQLKVAVSTFLREVLLRLCIMVLIALVAFKVISFHVFIIGNILVYLVPLVAMLYIAAKTKGFGFSLSTNVFSRTNYKEMIHFSWYHLLFGVTSCVMGYLDPLMLSMLDKGGFSTNAIYTWGIFVVSVMTMPYKAMSTSSFTILNNAYIANDTKKLFDLFHRSAINILIVALGMFLLISNNLDNAVALLPKGFEMIKPIVLILMVGRICDMATGFNSEIISISKYYKFNFRISFLLVALLFILNFLLIPRYSIYGAAWGSTLALAIFNIAKLLFLWVKMGLQPFNKKSLLVALACIVTGVISYLIPIILNPIIDTAIRSIIIIVLYSALLIWFKPSADLNMYLESIKKNKRLF
ncbi:MAG: polysaccharide biosynthesis C-terminal domain-containing protein [Bacteroidota bacterium]